MKKLSGLEIGKIKKSFTSQDLFKKISIFYFKFKQRSEISIQNL